ncbi:Uncharacterised protein [Shigella sonnei]|nr:Uncharacterised protein [Shigella sonnei]
MPFLHIASHGGNIHPIQRLLLRFTKVDTDFFDVGGDHQNVGVNFTGQQRGREIFVNNRVHALVIPRFSTHYRNSTAARANYDKTLLDQRLNGGCFDNTFRFRRGDHAAIAPSGIFNKTPVRVCLL